MVPITAAPREAASAAAVTNPLPARFPNSPFSRKPAKGARGMSQRLFSIGGLANDERGRMNDERAERSSVFSVHHSSFIVPLFSSTVAEEKPPRQTYLSRTRSA